MPDYAIPPYPTTRLRYFNNQFLNEQDFIDEDAYEVGREQAFRRALCVAGVCEGLTVTYAADAKQPPQVAAGSAIDASGRLIVLAQATSASSDVPTKLANGPYQLYIQFQEVPTDMAAAASGGTQDNTRWTQQPVVAAAKPGALPDGAVVLGSFTVTNGAITASGPAGRQYSGVRLPGPSAASLASSSGDSGGAVLGAALTIQRTDTGQVAPILTVMNGAANVFSVDSAGMARMTTATVSGLGQLTQLKVTGAAAFSGQVSVDTVTSPAVSAKSSQAIGLDASGTDTAIRAEGGKTAVLAKNSSGVQASLASGGLAGDFQGSVQIAKDCTVLDGNISLRRHLVMLGTTDGSQAQLNEVVGGIGFLGYGQTHGELAYRAASGFEFVDTSSNAPRVGYAPGAYPLAPVAAGKLTVSGNITFTGGSSAPRATLGANVLGPKMFPRAWARIDPNGNANNGVSQPVIDGYNIGSCFNYGNYLAVNLVTPMANANYIVLVTFDDATFGSGTFNAIIKPQVSGTTQFFLRAMNPSLSYFALGSASGVHIFVVVFAHQ